MIKQNQTPLTPLPPAVADIMESLFARRLDLRQARDGLIQTYQALVATFSAGGILYLCGNGGSFADAVHIKGELAKRFVLPRPLNDPQIMENLRRTPDGAILIDQLEQGLPVVVLGESHSLRSAYANDRHPHLVYAQELNSFAAHIKPGVLWGISTSGNAENVAAAAILARAYGLTTISFTGPAGGRLAQGADIDWRVPGDSTHQIQENQIPLYHALCLMIEARFYGHAPR